MLPGQTVLNSSGYLRNKKIANDVKEVHFAEVVNVKWSSIAIPD